MDISERALLCGARKLLERLSAIAEMAERLMAVHTPLVFEAGILQGNLFPRGSATRKAMRQAPRIVETPRNSCERAAKLRHLDELCIEHQLNFGEQTPQRTEGRIFGQNTRKCRRRTTLVEQTLAGIVGVAYCLVRKRTTGSCSLTSPENSPVSVENNTTPE